MQRRFFYGLILAGLLATTFAVTNLAVTNAAEPKCGGDCGVPVFTGASLDDFVFVLADGAKKEDVFSIDNGVLKVVGKPFGWIAPNKRYKNFVVTGEFRYPNPADAKNSGLFIRVNGDEAGFLPRCIETQLAPGSMGTLFGFWDMKISAPEDRFTINTNHKLCKIMRNIKSLENAKHDDLSQWHKIQVICVDDVLFVRINGKVVNWAVGVEEVAGYIAFQSEGSPVEFRNFFIKELK